jgi:hypothetical protein
VHAARRGPADDLLLLYPLRRMLLIHDHPPTNG